MKDCRRHHPWRTLRDQYPHIDIAWDDNLPDGVAGFWDGETTIFLDPRLTQRARRCALEHETTHVNRGFVPVDEVLRAREEGKVDEIAARNLISLDMLADALRWCRGVAGAELADEVWTDQHALNVRLAHLTPAERTQIESALADCDWMN
ncbi:hypothetical protein [Rhodococcus sp. NPDC127528]|uniref:hypothetical protein n=1 Tax=unclassified Rhodococcus (in: high G+C Gram-positive bacteria) TaxID=192944 RepID=UPI0036396EF6